VGWQGQWQAPAGSLPGWLGAWDGREVCLSFVVTWAAWIAAARGLGSVSYGVCVCLQGEGSLIPRYL